MSSSSYLVLPSLNPKTLILGKPQAVSVSITSLSHSLKVQTKPFCISTSFNSAGIFETLSSRFVRKVAVSSQQEQEEELVVDEGEQNFSPDLKLFVGNLPFNVDSAELAGLFERAGNVEMVEVLLFYFYFSYELRNF